MIKEQTIFGPAGNGDEFYTDGGKTTLQAPGYLEKRGLNAYEYQCGRGVRLSGEAASALGKKGQEYGVHLSVHAPYYISLASDDERKRLNSVTYITDSGRAVWGMGGSRIVVHPGGLNRRSRTEAAALACDTLRLAQQALDEQGLSGVHICPETMGKLNQLGDLDEVLLFCGVDERFLPCVDFGHLNSRTQGGINSPEAFSAVLDAVENAVGQERARCLHIHFSKIAYSAGGEQKHLTFSDTEYGPEPAPLMELLARRDYAAVVICESAGTQVSDALHLKQLYERALARR
ncbi:MAG: TIM barrel protein [Clostridiales bacterium]|nr:TIM barrel protein [Clostridiales bacterium]